MIINKVNEFITNRSFSKITERENEVARAISRRANINPIGQLQVRAIKASATTKTNILEFVPQQRAKNLFEELGVKYISEAQSNLKYPLLNGNESVWADEVENVEASNTTTTSIFLQPKRLVSICQYSRDVLNGTDTNVTEEIERDLINSVFEKVQTTMLNSIYTDESANTIATYDDIVNLMYQASTKKISNGIYVVSPLAAKALKKMKNGESPIYQNGNLNGYKVIETPSLEGNKLIFADFSKLLLVQWGALFDITVNDRTKAKDGIVELIINSYWNWGKLDDNAFVFAKFTE